jgi:predicted site-specific integrase-resolvase
MVEDPLSIVQTFSGGLHGMRKYRKRLRENNPEYSIKEPKDILPGHQ